MPSPFPGMDPFLEEPAIWPTVHQGLISLAWMELNRHLPHGYVATIEERVFLIEPPRTRYPDVHVVKHPRQTARIGSGAAAVAVLDADPALDIEFPPAEFREPFIEIHLARKPGTLIAVLEVLSPTNKKPGEGRDLYLEKQEELRTSKTHLIEIDLLRAGQHTVMVPRDRLDENGWDYLICLHKGGWRNKFRVWPRALPERLPRFEIPLAGTDVDVIMDLQALVDQCYDAGRFDERIDYRGQCPPPLTKKNAKWIDELLRKKKRLK
ncbi:MAG: DUF4058 family protein [Planctomycetes bacterium]|nr:DUF4058 family protein [Planctomycetota bacterium]